MINQGGTSMDMSQMMGKIEMTAAQRIRAEDGDYLVDGLLYCHKCHTPKQCRIEVLGQIRTPMCLCQCEQDRMAAEEDARKRQEAMDRVKRLRKMGFPDDDMAKWTFEKDDHSNAKISTLAKRYVENFRELSDKGKGLLLYGPVGTGKTFISACIANALIEQGHPCLVTNFARLTNTISGMYDGKQEYVDSLNRFDLLVIDDLASERDTEYMGEIVQNIIDARYRSGKPLIVTTNLTSDELKHPADIRKQRIYSRLFEMSVPVEVRGKDRRKEKLRQDYMSMWELLGLKETE
jgi:DNA replication protein DnaC